MERITVKAKFHTAHRQLDFPGHCVNVHGHTWKGRVSITCEEFPRDEIGISLEFGTLKRIMKDLDHKIIASSDDKTFLNPDLFDQKGVKIIPGKGPSSENLANYIWDEVVKLISGTYPGQGITYMIEVEIYETENNIFEVIKDAVV
jgi:6-pyruvoyltetrahydropterin/6-carboxytetrahydropterin synthase